MSDKKYPSNLYLESVTTSVDFASHVSVETVIVMAKELLALRNRKGRTMPRHEFSQMVNELRDVPPVQSKREKMVRVLHAFNINPAQPE